MNAARKVPTTLFGEKSSPSKAFNLVPPRLCAYDTNSPVYGGFIPRTTGMVVSLIIMSGQLLTLAAFPPMLVRGGGLSVNVARYTGISPRRHCLRFHPRIVPRDRPAFIWPTIGWNSVIFWQRGGRRLRHSFKSSEMHQPFKGRSINRTIAQFADSTKR